MEILFRLVERWNALREEPLTLVGKVFSSTHQETIDVAGLDRSVEAQKSKQLQARQRRLDRAKWDVYVISRTDSYTYDEVDGWLDNETLDDESLHPEDRKTEWPIGTAVSEAEARECIADWNQGVLSGRIKELLETGQYLKRVHLPSGTEAALT